MINWHCRWHHEFPRCDMCQWNDGVWVWLNTAPGAGNQDKRRDGCEFSPAAKQRRGCGGMCSRHSDSSETGVNRLINNLWLSFLTTETAEMNPHVSIIILNSPKSGKWTQPQIRNRLEWLVSQLSQESVFFAGTPVNIPGMCRKQGFQHCSCKQWPQGGVFMFFFLKTYRITQQELERKWQRDELLSCSVCSSTASPSLHVSGQSRVSSFSYPPLFSPENRLQVSNRAPLDSVACFSHTSLVPWERCRKNMSSESSHPASYASKHAGVHTHACADTHTCTLIHNKEWTIHN